MSDKSVQILVLDDDLDRHKRFKSWFINQYTPVYTADECIEKLKSQNWDYVFLDHDLGGEVMVSTSRPDTGSGVCRWIAEQGSKDNIKTLAHAHFYIHTMNPEGSKNMMSLLDAVDLPNMAAPFFQLNSVNMDNFFNMARSGGHRYPESDSNN